MTWLITWNKRDKIPGFEVTLFHVPQEEAGIEGLTLVIPRSGGPNNAAESAGESGYNNKLLAVHQVI